MPDLQAAPAEQTVRIVTTVNGVKYVETVESRLTLADFLRGRLRLTGTHLGCEHGVCGACTVLVDGAAVRACLMFAAQVDDCEVETVENLAAEGDLTPLQKAFSKHHAVQCGFCTSGFLMSATAALREGPVISDEEARDCLSGNICRCTGYAGLVRALIEAGNERTQTDE
jgi:aerobic-type carbon monoxide dehydrogenase small subunit (CoxS/CutS family)